MWRALGAWRSGERAGAELALVIWLLAYIVGIGANLSLDWPRYYVPTAFYGSLLIGLGVDLALSTAVRRSCTSATSCRR